MMKTVTVIIISLLMFEATLAQEKKLSPEQLLEKGQRAHDAGRYAEALALYNACLEQAPAMAEAYFYRAATREQTKDLAGALTDYSIYLEMHPQHFEARLNRANVRYSLEKYAQAKDDYRKLIDLPTGETNTVYYKKSASARGSHQIMTARNVMKPMIFNYLALTEIKLKNFSTAISWLDSAIQLQPGEADYYVNRGIAREGLYDPGAADDYARALSLNPSHTVALHNLGVLQRKRGDKTGTYLEQAIETDSTMLYPYVERAFQRLEGGFYKGALEDYNIALSIEDTDPEIWFNRGLVKEKLNDLKGAYADYTQALRRKEDYAKAWLNRGNVLNKQGRFKEAVEDYTAAITFNERYAPAYYNRAIANQRLKRFAEACADLEKAAALGQAVDERLKRKVCAGTTNLQPKR